MKKSTCLCCLAPGECARIREVLHTGGMCRRLSDLGFLPGTRIRCVGRSPLGDPSAYLLRGAVIALREEDSSLILVERECGENGT